MDNQLKFCAPFFIADGRLDQQADKFEENSVECPDELPLTFEFGKDICGIVKVKQEGNKYYGEFTVLPNEYYGKKMLPYLTPAISGKIKDSTRENGVTTIRKCFIDAVTLTIGNNCDHRIKKLKDILIEEF
jgi:hypothetical protein